MHLIFRIIFFNFALISVSAISKKEAIEKEINEVTNESRSLAKELADMLSVLEIGDLRNEAVEAAVIGDDTNVQTVLQQMVQRINALENNDPDEIKGVQIPEKTVEISPTSSFTEDEERLKNSLDNLEVVANEIKRLSSTAKSPEEIRTVNKMAKILEAMTAKLSVDELKISVDLVLGRDEKINVVENDIENMIDSLVNTVAALKTKPTNKTIYNYDTVNEKEYQDRYPKQFENLEDVEILDVDKDIEDIEETLESEANEESNKENNDARKPIIIRRKLDRQVDGGLFDDGEEGSGDGNGEVDALESCRTSNVTNNVKMCTPGFETLHKPGKIVGQRPQEVKHCYEVTRSVCEEVTNIVSREVCSYPYVQKTAMAVAHITEIGFETRFKGMEVSRCHTYIENTVDGHREVEKCKDDFVEKKFLVPTVHEGFEDLVELQLPDPKSDCRIFKLNIPETICRDITTTECSTVTYIEDTLIPSELQIVTPSHKPSCSSKVLTQFRQVCTVGNDSEVSEASKLLKNANPRFLDDFFDESKPPAKVEDYMEFQDSIEVEDLFTDVEV